MSDQLCNIGASTKNWAQSSAVTCLFQESCESTNDWAKREKDDTQLCLYLTNHQTKGRGRGQNEWTDFGNGSYLLSTWSFPLDRSPQHITAPLFGLAVFRAARSTWPSLEWSLKAPNDIYLCDKKVAGLLIETIQQGSQSLLIVGFGMNILEAPEELTSSCCLIGEKGLGRELEQSEWFQFLSELSMSLKSASLDCLKHDLSQEHRDQLVEALNLNPLRPGLILEVSSNGDIEMEKDSIPWTEL